MVGRNDLRNKNEKINMGVVGLGTVSRFQLSALKNFPELKVVATCDTDPSKRLREDVPFFTSVEEMLTSNDEINVVLLSVPTPLHYKVGKGVLKRGKDLLVEKPAAENIEQFNELREMADRKKKLFETALHFRYSEDVVWFRSHTDEIFNKYGNIDAFCSSFNDPYFKEGHLYPGAVSLSGSWLDSGINALSAIGDLLTDIRPEERSRTDFEGVDIHSTAFFSFNNEKDTRGYGVINTNWNNGSRAKSTNFYLSDKATKIELNHTEHSVKLHRNGNSEVLFASGGGVDRVAQHYVHVFREFLKDYRQRMSNIYFSNTIHSLLFGITSNSSNHFNVNGGAGWNQDSRQ